MGRLLPLRKTGPGVVGTLFARLEPLIQELEPNYSVLIQGQRKLQALR